MTISAQKPEIMKNNDFPNFPENLFCGQKKGKSWKNDFSKFQYRCRGPYRQKIDPCDPVYFPEFLTSRKYEHNIIHLYSRKGFWKFYPISCCAGISNTVACCGTHTVARYQSWRLLSVTGIVKIKYKFCRHRVIGYNPRLLIL